MAPQEGALRVARFIWPGKDMHIEFHNMRSIFNFPRHRHAYYEFFMIERGSLNHQLNGKNAVLHEKVLCLFGPEDEHDFLPGREYTQDFNLVLQPAYFERFVRALGGEEVGAFLANRGRFIPMRSDMALEVWRAARCLHMYGEQNLTAFNRMMSLLASVILTAKLDDAASEIPAWISDTVEAYQTPDMFCQDVSRLYDFCGRAPEHVCRCFRRYLFVTPTQFLNERRLEYAQLLLRSTAMPVVEICFASGFESLSHFNHCFKAKFGCPPSAFR